MPSNATVATRWTMLPLLIGRVAETAGRKNNTRTKVSGWVCARTTVRSPSQEGSRWVRGACMRLLPRWHSRAAAHAPRSEKKRPRHSGSGPCRRLAPCQIMRRGAWCAAGAISSPRPTPISGRRWQTAQNDLPATISRAAIVTLQAGTKKFGIPLFGLFGEYPHYSVRSGAEMTIEDRFNSCMTRSMNGRALPVSSPEMQAMMAYIKFLSTGVAPGELLPGLGTGKMPELDRPADPSRGKTGYASACEVCHGPNGAGIRRSLPTTDLGYVMPPLWGGDSFNDGAGMARLITAANFIHFNMPHGADYLNPQLSPEQAWDIAAYVISQPRPHKAGLDKDFPDLLEKPVDAPYGPYADGFSEQQHKYGPFATSRAAIAKLKAEQKAHRRADARRPTQDRHVSQSTAALVVQGPRRLASILSQISAAASGPPRSLTARIPVGEVTLISVK